MLMGGLKPKPRIKDNVGLGRRGEVSSTKCQVSHYHEVFRIILVSSQWSFSLFLPIYSSPGRHLCSDAWSLSQARKVLGDQVTRFTQYLRQRPMADGIAQNQCWETSLTDLSEKGIMLCFHFYFFNYGWGFIYFHRWTIHLYYFLCRPYIPGPCSLFCLGICFLYYVVNNLLMYYRIYIPIICVYSYFSNF